MFHFQSFLTFSPPKWDIFGVDFSGFGGSKTTAGRHIVKYGDVRGRRPFLAFLPIGKRPFLVLDLWTLSSGKTQTQTFKSLQSPG